MNHWEDYTIEQELGRGATARVVCARKKNSEDVIALKIFHPAFWDQEKRRIRAFGEFRAVSTLKHPNIVQVLEAKWDSDPPGVALEFIDGMSLEKFQPRLPYILPEVSVKILIEVLSALEHAHEHGVIHRDLKPENILISNGGRVVVTDFGMAKMTDMSKLTLSGTILGSPDYMSPEQARGDTANPASDLFSAGAILYFLITGTRPFSRHSPLATLAAVCNAEFEPVQRRNPKVSNTLSRVLYKALAKNPKERFKSATAFKAELQSYLDALDLNAEHFSFESWMQNPNDWGMDALQTMVEALSLSCEKAIKNETWDAALETLSHLGTIAPESAAFERLTQAYKDAMRATKKKRTVTLIAPAILSLTLCGTWVTHRFIATPRPQIQAAAPASATPVPQSSKDQTIRSAATVSAVRKVMAPVELSIPDGIRVYWDNKRVLHNHILPQKVGYHELRLEKPGAAPIHQKIWVDAVEPTVIKVH